MYRVSGILILVLVLLLFGTVTAQQNKQPQQANGKPKVVREKVPEGLYFTNLRDRKPRTLISGKAKVVNANTLVFGDGTKVRIGLIDAPEIEQKGRIGDSFYPCGKEAADFLKKLVGDQTVTFLPFGRRVDGLCYAGETNLGEALVLNGWAIAGHSGHKLAEVIARKNKRGLWQGEFVLPTRWRDGERLPGE